jgi:hypothetical protein
MIYCFDCEEYHEYFAEAYDMFIECPCCGSTLIVLLGEITMEKIGRVCEKLEVVWGDHNNWTLGELLEQIYGLPTSDVSDDEVEKCLDDFLNGDLD